MSKRGSTPPQQRPEGAALPDGPQPVSKAGRAARRAPLLTWLLSGAAHGLVFGALLWQFAQSPPQETKPDPILISLVDEPKPDPEPPGPPGPPGPPDTQQAKVEVPTPVQRPIPKAAPAPSPDAEEEPKPDTFSDVLSDSQIAVAALAGEEGGIGGGGNGGGGECNMAHAVQQALRRDPLVHASVGGANRLGKSIMLWNGDWVQAGVQDGKGLSAVREAVLWTVGFAPEACRNRQMHGLVLLSLADGNTRFAIGAGEWRWADLLDVRRAQTR